MSLLLPLGEVDWIELYDPHSLTHWRQDFALHFIHLSLGYLNLPVHGRPICEILFRAESGSGNI